MGTTFRYLESSYGRTYADVITKISRMDSLPNYLSYSAPLACASRAQGAPLRIVQRQQGPVVWELTSRAGGNHSVGSNLGVVIYLLLFLYTFFLFIFFRHIFALWLVSLYSHCGPFPASQDFCSNMETRRVTVMQAKDNHNEQ